MHFCVAEEGSSECMERPPCTTKDYFQIHTPCDEEGKVFAAFSGLRFIFIQPSSQFEQINLFMQVK